MRSCGEREPPSTVGRAFRGARCDGLRRKSSWMRSTSVGPVAALALLVTATACGTAAGAPRVDPLAPACVNPVGIEWGARWPDPAPRVERAGGAVARLRRPREYGEPHDRRAGGEGAEPGHLQVPIVDDRRGQLRRPVHGHRTWTAERCSTTTTRTSRTSPPLQREQLLGYAPAAGAGAGALVIPATTGGLAQVSASGLPAGHWSMAVADLGWECAVFQWPGATCSGGSTESTYARHRDREAPRGERHPDLGHARPHGVLRDHERRLRKAARRRHREQGPGPGFEPDD